MFRFLVPHAVGEVVSSKRVSIECSRISRASGACVYNPPSLWKPENSVFYATAENKLTEWLEGRVSAILNGQYMLAGRLDTEERCAVVFTDKA